MRIVLSFPNVRDFFTRLFEKFKRAGRDSLAETVEEIRREMSVEGKPVTYPIQWDSERQRRAYFATNGFGRGIPYVRQGSYIRGWQVRSFPEGYELSNKHPAGAVGGTMPSSNPWQSRIHKNRWNNIFTVTSNALRKLSSRVRQKLRVIIRNG
jgi:hypothetical protein